MARQPGSQKIEQQRQAERDREDPCVVGPAQELAKPLREAALAAGGLEHDQVHRQQRRHQEHGAPADQPLVHRPFGVDAGLQEDGAGGGRGEVSASEQAGRRLRPVRIQEDEMALACQVAEDQRLIAFTRYGQNHTQGAS